MDNPITVLCFGDSNTRGTRPDIDNGRFGRNVRWTGQLQHILGDKYYVIEEGLGGRTTNLEHPRTEKLGRNGLRYFFPCIESHSPLDFVVIMLGTNDFKNVYSRSPEDVANVLEDYVLAVEQQSSSCKVILVSPPHITAKKPVVFYDAESEGKSKELAPKIEKLANRLNVDFVDAANIVQTGEDGVHWDEPSHEVFAKYLAKILESKQ